MLQFALWMVCSRKKEETMINEVIINDLNDAHIKRLKQGWTFARVVANLFR